MCHTRRAYGSTHSRWSNIARQSKSSSTLNALLQTPAVLSIVAVWVKYIEPGICLGLGNNSFTLPDSHFASAHAGVLGLEIREVGQAHPEECFRAAVC